MRRRILLNSGGIDIDPITGRGMIGNYEVVDLGLPSGLLWATCNVGANIESDYGKYYQWGTGAVTYQKVDQYHTGGTDSSYTLPSSADTATQVMGEGWRMPTKDELQDLLDNTNYEIVENFNGSSVNGGKITSKTNPNAYVFFPFAGTYDYGTLYGEGGGGRVWSSTPYNEQNAYNLSFGYGNSKVDVDRRYYGTPVRGVHAAI